MQKPYACVSFTHCVLKQCSFINIVSEILITSNNLGYHLVCEVGVLIFTVFHIPYFKPHKVLNN
jgi:hypothetical protein